MRNIVMWLLATAMVISAPAAQAQRPGKSFASVIWIQALLLVARFSWSRSGES